MMPRRNQWTLLPVESLAELRKRRLYLCRLTQERKLELANLLHFGATEPDFLSWRVADLPCAAPFLCRHLRRIPVMAWTVRTSEDAKRAARYADQMVFEGFVPAARPDDVPADAPAEA